MLRFLLSLVLGKRRKPASPAAPGTSHELHYPVLLVGQRGIRVVDDSRRLTTTRGSSGVCYSELRIIDRTGLLYEIVQSTDFGRKPWMIDLGTSDYRVYLALKPKGTLTVDKTRKLLIDLVKEPGGTWHQEEAEERLNGFRTMDEIVEGCRDNWSWR